MARQPDPSQQALHDMGAFLHHWWPVLVAVAVLLLVVARPKPDGPSTTGRAVGATGRAAAPYALEWVVGLAVLAWWAYWARRWQSPAASAALTALVLGAWLLAPQTRNATRACFGARKLRRKWTQAVIDSGAADPPPMNSRRPHSYAGPRVRSVRRVPLGHLLAVEAGRGGGIYELERSTERLREILRVREVRVTRDRRDSGKAEVLLVRADPFEATAPIPWPAKDAAAMSLWNPVPLGVSEQGAAVALSLVERNLLVGGIPGSGKSVTLNLFVAAAALDPGTELWLLDAKRVELTRWAPCAAGMAGPDRKEAIALLQRLQDVMQDRYRQLEEAGEQKIERRMGWPLHLLACDELASYLVATSDEDRKDAKTIAELLRNIVALGRAAGVIVVAATQKPDAETIPTNLRDLFAYAIAFRCRTWQASDTILGTGSATNGANAAKIPNKQAGVGILQGEGEEPLKLRSYFLGQEDVAAICDRTKDRRMEDELQAMLAPVEARSGTQRPAPPNPRPTPGKPTAPAPTPPPPNTPHAQHEGVRRGHPRAVADRARLLALLADGETWTLARLEADGAMGAPRLQWRPELDALVEEGVVLRWLAKPVKDGRPAKAARGNPWLIRLAGADESGQAPHPT